MWGLQVYQFSDYVKEFNALDIANKNRIDSLLKEIISMQDPEDHRFAVDCSQIIGINYAVKFQDNNLILIVALDRIMEDTDYEEDVISLYSCSE